MKQRIFVLFFLAGCGKALLSLVQGHENWGFHKGSNLQWLESKQWAGSLLFNFSNLVEIGAFYPTWQ